MKRLMIYGAVIAVLLLVVPAVVAAVPTTVTVFLHNEGDELAGSQYFIKIPGIGTKYSGDTFTVDAPKTITYVAWTGPSTKGTPATVTIDPGQLQLPVEYATVTVKLTAGGAPIGLPMYHLEIVGIGTESTGDVFEVPVGAQITYQACTNSVCGPFLFATFLAPGAQDLTYDYSVVTVDLYNGLKDLDDPALYYLDIDDIGTRGYGEKFFVPEDAGVSFHAVTATTPAISGPTLQTSFGPGPQVLAYEYATVKVRLYSAGGDLIDENYYLNIEGIGDVWHDDEFEVPADAVITYQACTDTICSPWQTKSFVAGDQIFSVEYATVTIKLYNGVTQLPDKNTYLLEIQGIEGKLGYGDTFVVPENADVNYRAWTGTTISGPWIMTSFTSMKSTLSYEYASVKFVFDLTGGSCTLQTSVTGIGNIANGAKAHVPDSSDVTFRADVCGWMSSARTIRFYRGEGTVRWTLTSTYTRP